ncbi:hypothetical protein RIF29_30846 [Crotalaria pallida]|uniref:Uncharacterized protein n=1 Tax=Crotalaria pallida TaxID=3830 RepID=A0AAN9EIZ0_CROPI
MDHQGFIFTGDSSGYPKGTTEPPDRGKVDDRGNKKWASFRDACLGKESKVAQPEVSLKSTRWVAGGDTIAM